MCVSFAPVVAHGIREDASGPVERCCSDAAADFWVSFESVLGVLVPEVECAVRACGAKCAVDRVEGYGVYRENLVDIAVRGVGLAVAFE